jgi:S1-C subfamily serine protease
VSDSPDPLGEFGGNFPADDPATTPGVLLGATTPRGADAFPEVVPETPILLAAGARPLPEVPTHATTPMATQPRRRRGVRQVLVAGLVGGIVGALVAAGMWTVLDDQSSTSAQAPRARDVIVRPSDQIPANGDIAAILKADVPAVVAIVDDGGPGKGGAAGTGFVVSGDGVIVTNNHVVEGATKIQARFSDGTKLTAKVLGTAPSSDLAVLQVEGTNLPTVELGDSDAVQVGDDVVAIGNALALEGGLSVTRGIVSGLHRDVQVSSDEFLGDVIQTDAAINPGNSGGPLVDAQGRVIAINTAIADPSNAQSVGFAIPISQVKALISELQGGRHPALLGVTADFDSEGDGAVIASVSQGSPADNAGLQAGDRVVQVGNTPVHSSGGLRPAIRRYKAGQEIDVIVNRDGSRTTLHVTLGEATEAES